MKYRELDLTFIPDGIELDAIKSYIDFRCKIKKPLTQRAFNQAMAKALEAPSVGMTPTELIDFTVDKGWSGINLQYTANARVNEFEAASRVAIAGKVTTRQLTLKDELDDNSWAN